ncbi:MAG: FkbM family methyltransferase [Syntrophorhabdaceae bacterium]|nr:FkbM family methyltransferase [Syntrophorhabdaceae bacterium]
MDINKKNMSLSEKRQMLANLLLNLYRKHQIMESSKLYYDNELYKLIRDLLAVISDDDQANVLALRSYDALQDDESRRIHACLFLCKCIGISDIAGMCAEFEALKGAENTIRRCKPKLAVCIYHKPSDVVEIPALIMNFFPEYKLYIRQHHARVLTEIVLYALPQ